MIIAFNFEDGFEGRGGSATLDGRRRRSGRMARWEFGKGNIWRRSSRQAAGLRAGQCSLTPCRHRPRGNDKPAPLYFNSARRRSADTTFIMLE